MPVEIRELHIKVVVTEGAPASSGAGSAGTSGTSTSAIGGEDREALIAECVEQVMHILREREER
ncbi:DUF5908 family protein [Rufibacter hautae]|uniref:Uncharacterized protein n=1 Tax=Rufibacter hautae TaxID=2595005 RepID=A0A5B6TEY9_9BACT|nr:DUF5908 family protein [Rufibacter hautae]KAA3438756.1 hypothetical protein FOA19_16195 [Rufibacter hautae]